MFVGAVAVNGRHVKGAARHDDARRVLLDVLLRFGRTVVSAGLVLLVPWLNGVISPVEAGGRYTKKEGDLVELRGFIVQDSPRPKPSGPESVNCRLTRAANNDIHIPIVEEAQDEEFAAIVVEMIPQARPGSWNPTKLKGAARGERPVIIRGRLFYDNKHEVNDDSEHDNGQPKRFSLWEIHPISEFWVCIRADRKCGETLSKPKDWKKLADF